MIHVPSEADEWGGRKYNHCLCINLMSLKGSYLETSYSLTTFCKYKCLSWAASPKAPGTNQMDEKNNLWGAGHLFSISCHRGFLQIALHCRYYRQCIRIPWAASDAPVRSCGGALRLQQGQVRGQREWPSPHTTIHVGHWGLTKTKPSICRSLFFPVLLWKRETSL